MKRRQNLLLTVSQMQLPQLVTRKKHSKTSVKPVKKK
nr:MAG TPA: hypothetical protein [Bacteriophage sp.]